MQNDIQKAGLWQRIAAGILDLILVAVLATGFGWLLSSILDYDQYFQQSETIRMQYTAEFDLPETVTQEMLDAMTPEEYDAYLVKVDAADEAIRKDPNAVRVLSMVVNLALIIASGGILLAMTILEFVIPLLFGNGQTVGKKVFGLCVVRIDGVKLNNLQLFTRFLLGKYAVGVMLPVYAAIMLLLNIPNLLVMLFAVILLLVQLVSFLITQNHNLLHDKMVGTVVVDYGSQKIFKSTEDLVEYQKKIAAERAARQQY